MVVSEQSSNGPLTVWVVVMTVLGCLAVVVAVNEREQWSPRTARTIPRRWWLRVPAFLFYSGAAGGVLHALLLFALTGLTVLLWCDGTWVIHGYGPMGPAGRGVPYMRNFLLVSFERDPHVMGTLCTRAEIRTSYMQNLTSPSQSNSPPV